VKGGETLDLAGLSIEVLFTPGHSPGHVTYAIRDEQALFSGDVLFQGSVGRVDLPGGDWPTLLSSIELLTNEFPPETTVYPGHMGITTLGREHASNPFLRELASQQ
jgi:glyoxylase-like metal-dependent hydrolase (beta-lactamase superfamily II)